MRLAFIFGLLLLAALPAQAKDYFVAVQGDDSGAGSEAQPFATLARAQMAATAGDTVYIRGGIYKFTSGSDANAVLFNKSGSSGKPISYVAYKDELPVLDFSGITTADRITGFRVTASWLVFKGLELKGVPQNITTAHESWGIYNTGSSNVYERLNLHHHMGPGLFIGQGKDNLVLNCDSHHNYDPKSSSGDGTNADGFGAHMGKGGTGNVFRGCRAWWNSDDGFDLIHADEVVTIESSWAWRNGYMPDTTTAKSDGNGFKGGGYGLPATDVPDPVPAHAIRFCLGFLNRSAGFYANHHPVAQHWENNTSFKNGTDFNMLGLNGNVGILRNNLAYMGALTGNASGIDDTGNSWNLPVMVGDADFQSVAVDGVDGPRKADGSLPDLPFMKLVAGSDLIDKGQPLGHPFVGAAPDLGAFEFGATSDTGAAGTPAAGGGGGAGGTAGAEAGAMAAAGSGGTSASAGRSGSAGAMAQPPRAAVGGSPAPTAGSGAKTSPQTSAGQPSITATAGSPGTPARAPKPNAGCSCNTTTGSTNTAALAYAAFAFWLTRRRRRQL
jgi:MYXO-CTERM domain-containing protein